MPRPWFKFYPADYLLDARVDALSLEAQGILVRLWCLCARDGGIPDDRKVVARRAGIQPKTLGKYWDDLRCYFRLESTDQSGDQSADHPGINREIQTGLLVSDRMIRENSEYMQICEKRRTSGSKGGRARQANAIAKGVAKPKQSEAEAEAEAEKSITPLAPQGEPAKPPAPASPVLMEVPCKGVGPKTWPLTEAKVTEWQAAYPGIDAKAELRKAVQWLRDNPAHGKTHRGMSAFFGRWLSKAQDRSSPGLKLQSHSPAHRARTDAEYLRLNPDKPAAPAPTPEESDVREGRQGLLKLLM